MKVGLFNILLMANPTDAFRIFNLTGFDAAASLAGMAAVAGKAVLPAYVSLIALAFWVVAPLGVAGAILPNVRFDYAKISKNICPYRSRCFIGRLS